MIELFKTTRASMKFDRMIPSGSSWLMGIRVQRVFDQAHSAMEPGKTIFISKFHQITGHTGEHLLKPTANYMKLRLIGRLPPCEVCAQAKIRQRNIPKKKMKKLPTRPGYRVFIDICSFKQVSRGGNRGISKKYNIETKRIRDDNSGENRSLQKECDKANLGINFEFTAPGTP